MYVVIAGGGLIGRGLAEHLVNGRHDVVVVEQRRDVCELLSSRTGALAINGTATDIDVLGEAGIRKADFAIAAMPDDASNLAFSVLAKNFKVPNVMVRMRDPQYKGAYKLVGVDHILNTSEIFVREITQEIEKPTVRMVTTLGRGKASIIVLTIPEGARVDGKKVSEIAQDKDFPSECIIAGIFREKPEMFVSPGGAVVIHSGEQVFLAAKTEKAMKAAGFLQRTK